MQTYGLIGLTLGHSFSKGFFTNKFKDEQITAQYQNFELPTIEHFTNFIKSNPSIVGLNVTIPYKEQIIPYLDDCSKQAKAIGAINVIQFKTTPNGDIRLIGHNSDVYGFTESIRPLLKPIHTKALILGTGGASKAILAGLKSLHIETLFVSRTKTEQAISYEEVTKELIEEYKVIINTTPLGMHPNENSLPAIPYTLLTKEHLLYDLVYNPETTAFMKAGLQQGATVKNGLEMLHLQAKKAWEIWNESP